MVISGTGPPSSSEAPSLRIGTRTSALATTQAGLVADALRAQATLVDGTAEAISIVPMVTKGDRTKASLSTLGGTGVFVTALREALEQDRCDIAVHSFKDLPTGPYPGLVIAAVPPRADVRDVLCARNKWTLATLPGGASVGTGSPRRRAQLLAARPDLVVVDLRGNVDTRLRRVAAGDLDAVVLAAAGLQRLGRLDAVTEYFDASVMLPAPGQGALAVECRAADQATRTEVATLDHAPTRLAVTAERSLLATLEAGCAAPVGAWATMTDHLVLTAAVYRADGSAHLHRTAEANLTGDREQDLAIAMRLGATLAADLLQAGAGALAALGRPRVLVPLMADGSQRLIEAINSIGCEPVVAPLLTVEPARDQTALYRSVEQLTQGRYDWLILTSARTVAALRRIASEASVPPLATMQAQGGFRVAAVGPATAATAQAAGLRVDLVPSLIRSTTGLLAALLASDRVPRPMGGDADTNGSPSAHLRALLPHSDLARPDLAGELRMAGWVVDDVIAYRTVLATSLPPDAQRVQAVVLTSSSSAVAWSGLRRVDPSDLHTTPIVCIGEQTAQSARDLRLTVAAVADSPTPADIAAALTDVFAGRFTLLTDPPTPSGSSQ